MNATTNTLQQTAMLFTLTIKQWSGKATDKRAAERITTVSGARQDAAKVSKVLVFSQLIDDYKKAANEARQEFYALTLPWMDDGRRLGSAKSYQKIMTKMAAHQSTCEKIAAKIAAEYPSMIDEGRNQLGTLFNESDYPANVGSKYAFLFRTEPIPSVDDIRVGLGEGERNKIAAQLKAQIEAAGIAAKRDIYQRAAECVSRIAESLPKFNPAEKGAARGTFRDTIITNVADLLDGLDGLNFDNDATIASLGDKMRALTAHTPDELREDEQARAQTAQTAQTAQDILETMAGYCGIPTPPPSHGQNAA